MILSSIVLLGLFSILYQLLSAGLPGLNARLFTYNTPVPNVAGGLANAIVGSMVVVFGAILIAIPWGLAVATYLIEYGAKRKFVKVIRFLNDVFLATPSILIGLFAYSICVLPYKTFSATAGIVSLVVIALPIIIRSSEDVLYLVSPLLKESALALGISRCRVLFSIVYKVSLNGLLTGFILALARIMGETAPLLFTTLNNSSTSFNLVKPIATLPVVIYQYALSPYANWQQLAWSGALLITAFILVINLLARYAFSSKAV